MKFILSTLAFTALAATPALANKVDEVKKSNNIRGVRALSDEIKIYQDGKEILDIETSNHNQKGDGNQAQYLISTTPSISSSDPDYVHQAQSTKKGVHHVQSNHNQKGDGNQAQFLISTTPSISSSDPDYVHQAQSTKKGVHHVQSTKNGGIHHKVAAVKPQSFIYCENGKYDFYAYWESDMDAHENSFTITNEWGTEVAHKTFEGCGTFCEFNVCLDYNIWYTLTLKDSYGDGLIYPGDVDGAYFYADAIDDDGTFLDEIVHLDTEAELAFGSEVTNTFCFGGCGV